MNKKIDRKSRDGKFEEKKLLNIASGEFDTFKHKAYSSTGI